MLLRHYWETVLGSKVKVKVLRTLCRYPGKRFTIRELAKLAGLVHSPVQRALADLEGMNLVHKEKHGTASLVMINRNSVIGPALEELFHCEQKTKELLEQEIRKLVRPVEMMALFGSIQKGTEQMNSDVDFLIVTNTKKAVQESIERHRHRFSERFGNLLSPVILTEKEFKQKSNKPYARELIQDYKIIAGKDLVKKWWRR